MYLKKTFMMNNVKIYVSSTGLGPVSTGSIFANSGFSVPTSATVSPVVMVSSFTVTVFPCVSPML